MNDSASVFDKAALAKICTMKESGFGAAFDLDRYMVDQPVPDDFFYYRDNGSSVLAVAHLDTVGAANERGAHYTKTEAGLVVHSRALDDRLGAYIILDMLPKLGIEYDILLTVGEESGRSTAAYFDAPKGKTYDWMIEFDRGGTDVVMYQYDDVETANLVKDCGAKVGDGIFSDICYLDHLGVKGFNWGVGYRDYHGPRAHAYLNDTFDMVDDFQIFHAQNYGTYLPHVESICVGREGEPDLDNPNDPFYVGSDYGSSRYDMWPPRRPKRNRTMDEDTMDLHEWLMRNA